ncbi:GtrA family protein [Microbacterium sp. 179-I 3D4 NHS]|uniref:GtrA family protein n=1 Tax=Microbacterium sp. 179-I 3D4 NHS TaxID=3142381 RepID=UPI0039A1689A
MRASLRRVLARVLGDQRVRFLAVGGVNTVLGYAIYAVLAQWVFAHVPLGYLLALIISYAIAICVAFVLYRRFVFVVKGNVLVDFVRFVGVYAVSILANAAALPVLVELLHLHPLVAQAIVLVVTTLISFVGHKHFSFRRRKPAAPVADTPASPQGSSGPGPIDSSS